MSEDLLAAARAAMSKAYAPYSGFPVGAAGRAKDGRIVTGCNVENAAYGVALCAECGMISELIMTGGGPLVEFVCVDRTGNPTVPCGRCRQLLWEHGGPDLVVHMPRGEMPMGELMVDGFGPANLEVGDMND